MPTRSPFGFLLLALLGIAAWAQEAPEYAAFDLAHYKGTPRRQGGNATTAECRPLEGQAGLRFRIVGKAGESAAWLLPLGSDLNTDFELRFAAAAGNLSPAPDGANLALLWTGGTPEAPPTPLWTVVGGNDSLAGRRAWTTRPGQPRLAGLQVSLVCQGDGEATLTLHSLRLSYRGNIPPEEAVTAALAQPPPLATRLELAGRPRLYAGANALAPILDTPGIPGERVVRCPLNLGSRALSGRRAPPLWPSPGYYDESALAAALAPAHANDWLWLDLYLDPPACDLDPAWRAQAELSLRLAFAWLRRAPAGRRVLGASVWLGLAGNVRPPGARDRQPAYLDAFRAWLGQRYASDAALAAAWRLPAVTRANAGNVLRPDWQLPGIGSLLQPLGTQPVRESWTFYRESWTGTLLWLAETAKRHGACLVGLGTGAPWDSDNAGPSLPCPPDFARLLASPAIDLWEIPASRLNPDGGQGDSGSDFLAAALAARHGKLLVLNVNLETLRGTSPEERRERLWRSLASAWWLGAGLSLQGQTIGLGDNLLASEVTRWRQLPARSPQAPETLFVADPAAPASFRSGAGTAAPELFYRLELPTRLWARAGLPFAVALSSAFSPEGTKLLVWHQTVTLDAAARQALRAAQGGQRVLLWSDACGALSERYLSARQMGETFGLNVELRPQPGRAALEPAPGLAEYLPSGGEGYFGAQAGPGGEHSGLAGPWAPRFAATDPEAKVLAAYSDGQAPALAARNYPDWTSLYSGSPVLNPEFLRAAARRAGCHVYLESNDWALIDDRFVVLFAEKAGVRTLKLPAEQPLYVLFRDQEIPAAQEHQLELGAQQCYLLYRGSKADYEQATR